MLDTPRRAAHRDTSGCLPGSDLSVASVSLPGVGIQGTICDAARLAAAVRARHDELYSALISVETDATARTELRWILAALDSAREIRWLRNRRGIGTVFVSAPATMPMYSLLLFAIAPALVGNEVVVRPASVSRRCAVLLADLAVDAGIPITVFDGHWEQFEAVAAEAADGVVFAGSAAHAESLARQLPDRIRLVCQGPGVCAMVVTESADVGHAAAVAVATRLFNNGQDCLATERVYVAAAVFDEFCAAVVAASKRVRCGANTDPATDLGPLLIPSVADRWMHRPHEHGTPLTGDGADVAVVVADADAPVVLSETFCPILPLVRYDDERELRSMLELGEFALGLTIFGAAPRFGTLDFGHVAIESTHYDHEDAWAPFGGRRGTTFVRTGGVRRAGPVLIPFQLSEWR